MTEVGFCHFPLGHSSPNNYLPFRNMTYDAPITGQLRNLESFANK